MMKQKTKKSVRRGGPASPASRRGEQQRLEKGFLLQRELLLTRDYAEAVIEAVPPLLVLDENLRVQTANSSFCKAFKIPSRRAINQPIYEIGNGDWNIPKLRSLLEEVLPGNNAFKDFEIMQEFEGIGQRTLLLSGQQVGRLRRILLFIEDITDQRKAQGAMRASEIRYRRIFEAARDGILILDPVTRKITEANPFMSELLGYPHDELVDKELWQIGLLKDEKASQVAFQKLRKKHFIRYENLPLQNKAGERHEVEFVSNLYDEDGHETIQCNIRDITERKAADEALRESEERFRVLFELGPVAVYYCDASGMIQNFNKRAVELWGRLPKKGNAEDRYCGSFKLYHPDGAFMPHAECPMAKVIEGTMESARDLEVVAERPDGSRITLIANVVPLKNPRGEVTGAINCFFDITERKQAERAILDAKNEIGRHALELEQLVTDRTLELRQTIGELEGFSYSVSHDMRAPLRAMQGFARFLVDEYSSKLDGQGVEYLLQIMRSSVRLDRLIQDVLSYTRILHAKLPMEPVELDRLVRDILLTLPNGQPIKPMVQVKGRLPKVMGNEALLAQIIFNLVSNGIKFVSPGTTPMVEISAEVMKDDVVRVWFKDNGVGIAPENHSRIFRLFERVYPTAEFEGTGIGLTIVRKAVERMGAEVGFDSALGKGSQFWLQLKKDER